MIKLLWGVGDGAVRAPIHPSPKGQMKPKMVGD